MKPVGNYTPLAFTEGRLVIAEAQIFTKLIKELMSDEDYLLRSAAATLPPAVGATHPSPAGRVAPFRGEGSAVAEPVFS